MWGTDVVPSANGAEGENNSDSLRTPTPEATLRLFGNNSLSRASASASEHPPFAQREQFQSSTRERNRRSTQNERDLMHRFVEDPMIPSSNTTEHLC